MCDERERRRQEVAAVLGCEVLKGGPLSQAQQALFHELVSGEVPEVLLVELRGQQLWRRAGFFSSGVIWNP